MLEEEKKEREENEKKERRKEYWKTMFSQMAGSRTEGTFKIIGVKQHILRIENKKDIREGRK